MKPEHTEIVQQMIDAGRPRDEIVNYVRQHTETVIDLEQRGPVIHNWVRRGIKISCEGAGHPHHSHFLFTPKR